MYSYSNGKRGVSLLLTLFILLLQVQAQIGSVASVYNKDLWRYRNPIQFGFTVTDMDFFDNNRGIAVGSNGGIAFTTDGGANWAYGNFSFMSPAGVLTSTSFQDVHFVSANIAYAAGSGGCIAKSTDGGVNWVFVRSPLYNNSKNINTVWFVNENKGYMGGEWNTLDSIPKVYFTNNGGSTWDSLTSPSGGTVTRIGYINNPNIAPQLYTVTGKGKEIQRIMFFDDNTGYITGNSQHSSGGPTIQIPLPVYQLVDKHQPWVRNTLPWSGNSPMVYSPIIPLQKNASDTPEIR